MTSKAGKSEVDIPKGVSSQQEQKIESLTQVKVIRYKTEGRDCSDTSIATKFTNELNESLKSIAESNGKVLSVQHSQIYRTQGDQIIDTYTIIYLICD